MMQSITVWPQMYGTGQNKEEKFVFKITIIKIVVDKVPVVYENIHKTFANISTK